MVEAILVGVAILAIGAAFKAAIKQPNPRAFLRRSFPTVTRLLGVHPPAKATWEEPQVLEGHVYLPITNQGGTAQFWATVERIEGTADPYPSPFVIRWCEQGGERREIGKNQSSLLYVVHIEPEGDIENYPIESGMATKSSVKRLRYHKPGRFRFMGLEGQEYVVYMDLHDPDEVQELSWLPTSRMYQRQVRVVVRLQTADGSIDESRAVVLRIRESKKPKKPGEGYHWGKDDEVVAEIESS